MEGAYGHAEEHTWRSGVAVIESATTHNVKGREEMCRRAEGWGGLRKIASSLRVTPHSTGFARLLRHSRSSPHESLVQTRF